VAVNESLVKETLCPDNTGYDPTVCREPYIDLIQYLFQFAEKDTKVFSTVKGKQIEMKKIVGKIAGKLNRSMASLAPLLALPWSLTPLTLQSHL
jgi:hypothetical protein